MFELFSIHMKRPARIQQRVEQRVAEGLCLHTDEDGVTCDRKATHRGDCLMHFQRFNRNLNALPKKKQPQYEASMVEDGQVLARLEINLLRSKDPMKKVAAMIAEQA